MATAEDSNSCSDKVVVGSNFSKAVADSSSQEDSEARFCSYFGVQKGALMGGGVPA